MSDPSLSGNRGGKRRSAPRSAAVHGTVQSISPSERGRRRGATKSATTQQLPISPPICAVQPGKVLELRTSLGLMRARAILEQQQHQLQSSEISPRDIPTRGHLKTARLKPLGVVADPTLSPDQCLGVIPVSTRNEGRRKQRPRSSTIPGVHFDLPGPQLQMEGRERVGRQVRVKRRSHSAVLTHSMDANQLFQLLSISRRTGLVPQKSTDSPKTAPAKIPASVSEVSEVPPSVHNRGRGVLLPVVQQDVAGIRVEVKSLRKAEHQTDGSSPQRGLPDQDGSPGVTKLPPILNSPSPKKSSNPTQNPTQNPPSPKKFSNPAEENLEDSTADPLPNQDQQNQNCTTIGEHSSNPATNSTENSPKTPDSSGSKRVSIVTLGEAEERPRSHTHKHKRHSSSNQNARLSLGWSPPQSIEPLKGSQLPIPHANSDPRGPKRTPPQRTAVGEGGDPERMTSPNMLSVNVNEFLLEASETIESP